MKREDFLSNAKGIIGDAADRAKEISNEALKASRSLAKNARKTVKTEKLDYEISKKYREIGKIVYAAYEEEGSYAGVADEICEEINALFDQIIAIKLGEDAEISDEEKEEIIEEVNGEIEDVEDDDDDIDDIETDDAQE